MARYFLFLFVVNTFLAILLFYKGGRTGISPKFFLYTAGISLGLGIAFPFLVGFLEFYQVIMIFIVAISVVAFKISGKSELSLPEEIPVLQVNEAAAEETPDEEPTPPKEEMPAAEEIIRAEEAITELPADVERAEDEVAVAIADILPEEEFAGNSGLGLEEVVIAAAEETEILETGPETAEEAEELKIFEPEPAAAEEKDTDEIVAVVSAPATIDLVPVGERRYELVAVKLPDETEPDATEPEKAEEPPEAGIGFELSERISANNTIESLVDKGVAAKVQGQYEQAIQAFLAALEMHPPVDLIQILTMDISDMYIKTGNYRLAWVGLENLLQDYEGYIDSGLRKEIYSKMKYMEILHGLLQKFNLLPAPLAEVPDVIRETAEEMTRRWKQEVF
ncbi:MAG: hypothetical protein ACOY4Q_05405 [Bacillota bacterium]